MDWIQVFDKPFSEMTLDELKLERRAHGWVRRKIKSNAYYLTTKLYALRQKPLYTKEEYTRMYEDGEISKTEYQTMGARMARQKGEIAVTEAQIQYGFAIVDHEDAICTELDELIDIAKTKTPKKKGKSGKPYYDPRQKITWTNHNEKNRTENLRPPARVTRMKSKWSFIRNSQTSADYQMRKRQPIVTWDRDRFVQIARAKGVYTDPVMSEMIAEELHTTVSHARLILETGKMTWGEIILIASLFEMTPVEFCDCFLSGVFEEVVDGKWVATVADEDKPALRAKTHVVSKSQEPQDGNDER